MNDSSFDEAFDKATQAASTGKRKKMVLSQVVVPVAIALLGIFTKDLYGFHPAIPIAGWFFVLLVYALLYFSEFPDYDDIFSLISKLKTKDEKIRENEKLIKSYKELVQDLYIKNIASFAMRSMSIEFISILKNGGSNKENFDEMFGDLIAPFYLKGDVIFGFEISEKWSIGVYLYDEDAKLLKPVWREKSATHPSSTLGRNWREGEGHVGKAFLDRRPILTGDANDESVAQLCRARGSKQQAYDNSTYISFASVPISIASDDERNPYGVLVMTSDRVGRFSEESSTEILMHVSETIAVILDLSGADIGCLLNPNQCIEAASKGETNDETGQRAAKS